MTYRYLHSGEGGTSETYKSVQGGRVPKSIKFEGTYFLTGPFDREFLIISEGKTMRYQMAFDPVFMLMKTGF